MGLIDCPRAVIQIAAGRARNSPAFLTARKTKAVSTDHQGAAVDIIIREKVVKRVRKGRPLLTFNIMGRQATSPDRQDIRRRSRALPCYANQGQTLCQTLQKCQKRTSRSLFSNQNKTSNL